MNRNETRIVNKKTGGTKSAKLAQLHLMPHDALIELMEHFGKGEKKYPSDAKGKPNYARGYKWSLSYDALIRHALLFWQGENIDEETGSNHLIAVAWHALTLAHYANHKKGIDDRWEKLV